MKKAFAIVGLASLALTTTATPAASAPSADEVVHKVLDADPWGMSGAVVSARVLLTDKRGTKSELAFSARSRRYDPPFSKTLVRFSAPADLAGAGFLQVQNRGDDDDRFLFLPELKRARRISGNLRSSAFMGTDFSFADLDRRDLREGVATAKADEDLGKFPCFHVAVAPRRADSPYARIELWVRKDNYLPLKMELFDRANVLTKTFAAQEVQRVSGQWFVTRSRMTTVTEGHATELVLEKVAVDGSTPDGDFTVRNLEKL